MEFKPTLQRQRDDAAAKGQLSRQRIFEGLLDRLDCDAPWVCFASMALVVQASLLVLAGAATFFVPAVGSSRPRARSELARPTWSVPLLT